MTDFEIIKHINDGANYYLKFFGNATHMDCHENDFYSYIEPQKGAFGLNFIYDVKINFLPEEEQKILISEIKTLEKPIWWGLQLPDTLNNLIYGKSKEKSTYVHQEGDEMYMALFPNEQKSIKIDNNISIKKVFCLNEFSIWANFVNEIMHYGVEYIHPENHYQNCKNGIINCFCCYKNNILVSAASILINGNIGSLEFVVTHPSYRKQGFAKAVCSKAIGNAFNKGLFIITLRASESGTKELYTSLGFRIYNHAL